MAADLALPVADLAAKRESPLVVLLRLGEAALAPEDLALVPRGDGLARPVADLAANREGSLVVLARLLVATLGL